MHTTLSQILQRSENALTHLEIELDKLVLACDELLEYPSQLTASNVKHHAHISRRLIQNYFSASRILLSAQSGLKTKTTKRKHKTTKQ